MIAKLTPVLVATLFSANVLAADTAALDLKDPRIRASYGIGVDIGSNMQRQKLDLDPKAIAAGLADAFAGKPALTAEEVRATLMEFQKQAQAKAEARAKTAGEDNLKAGKEFLEANAKKEGVKTTASGLQYKVVKQGDGAKPTATDKVTVHYTGTLIDGKKFDSSVDRGQPATFPLNGVIKGWTEGLQLMPVGSKFQFFIPADLAYGQNAPASIGPGQVLIFDVELLKIEAPAPPPAAANAQPVTSDIIKVPSADELKKGAKVEVIKADEAQKLIEKEKAKQPEKK